MRKFIFLLLVSPSMALAQWSHIRFTVMNSGAKGNQQKYDVVLHDQNSAFDKIFRKELDGKWSVVHSGPVTTVMVPEDARIDDIIGRSYRTKTVLESGKYNLEDGNKAAGLRVRSENKLILITPFGTAEVPWQGELGNVVQLGRGTDWNYASTYFIFSVQAREGMGTYVVLDGNFKTPVKIMEGFRSDPVNAELAEGILRITELRLNINVKEVLDKGERWRPNPIPWESSPPEPLLNRIAGPSIIMRPIPEDIASILRSAQIPGRMETIRSLKAAPSSSQVMDELIAQLDDREPLASSPNASALVPEAIRALLMREFPQLLELEKSDVKLKRDVEKLVSSLANLWFAQKAVSGELLRNTFIQRLEAAMAERKNCELALLTLDGPGSHAAAYFRSEALRLMNEIYQKLYRP